MRIRTLIFILLFPSICHALTGKVISVADGDTITILDSSKQPHKIRLYGIDCPEKGQPFGKAAKKHTSLPTYKKTASVIEYDTDKYGRTVGVVRVDGVNVNESVIQAGLAWQYRKYCKASFCNDWLELESRAKKSKVGLWKDDDPIPPWQWRKGVRNSNYNKGAVGGGYHGNV